MKLDAGCCQDDSPTGEKCLHPSSNWTPRYLQFLNIITIAKHTQT